MLNKAKASVGVAQAQVLGKTWQKLKCALSCLSIFRGQTLAFAENSTVALSSFLGLQLFDVNQLRHFNLFLLIHSIAVQY